MFTLDYQPIDCRTVLESATVPNTLPDDRSGKFTLTLPSNFN